MRRKSRDWHTNTTEESLASLPDLEKKLAGGEFVKGKPLGNHIVSSQRLASQGVFGIYDLSGESAGRADMWLASLGNIDKFILIPIA